MGLVVRGVASSRLAMGFWRWVLMGAVGWGLVMLSRWSLFRCEVYVSVKGIEDGCWGAVRRAVKGGLGKCEVGF